MDALKFIKERNRMCDYYTKNDCINGCADCPECDFACNVIRYVTPEYISDVEKWSQEHPRKTRQIEFLEMFPTARMDDVDVLDVCPADVDISKRSRSDGNCICASKGCDKCRHEFWMQEAE